MIDAEGLPLALAAVGGVSSVQDYEDFMAAGADAGCAAVRVYLRTWRWRLKRGG